jgi:ribonuclease E
MAKELIINALVEGNVRVAILEDGRLSAFFEQLVQDNPTRSNIYRGRIINVQPSLDACFVDYGAERHGFLPFSEIVDPIWSSKADKQPTKHNDKHLKAGQMITVQVEKEASGTKGARLTTDLSLAGRFMVLMPFSDTRGVSRKIEDPEVRRECRELADKLNPPKDTGLIVRTAGMGQSKRDLSRDLNFLIRLWRDIEAKARKTSRPGLLHSEADLVQRVLRDYFTSDIERVWIDDPIALDKAEKFFKLYMPRQNRHLKAYTERPPIFSHFGIEEQIDEIFARRVGLPSGGSLVIDQTEALVAIDVNSGKMKGQRNQEATAYETNLEAAREIARQLTLRDLGGIVVIDFIDMTGGAHKTAVERALRDGLRSGKARTRISKISTFGLCTLTRQRLGKSLRSMGHRECPTCGGSGLVPDQEVGAMRLLRKIRAEASKAGAGGVRVLMANDPANHLQNQHRAELLQIERELRVRVRIEASFGMEGANLRFESLPRAEEQTAIEPVARPVSNPPPEPRPVQPAGAVPANDGQQEPSEAASAGTGKKRRRRRRKKKSAESAGEADAAPAVEDNPQAVESETASPEASPSAPAAGEQKKRRRRRRRKKTTASEPTEPAASA